jgi:hypothetical protein
MLLTQHVPHNPPPVPSASAPTSATNFEDELQSQAARHAAALKALVPLHQHQRPCLFV